MLADDGAQQAGFADAVAAEDAGDLADLGVERNAAERLRRAVMEVDVFYFEHHEPRVPDALQHERSEVVHR